MSKTVKPLVGLLLALVAGLASADTIGVRQQGLPPFSDRDLKNADGPGASTAIPQATPFEAPTATPEPGAIALMLAGIAMIGTLSRRRKP